MNKIVQFVWILLICFGFSSVSCTPEPVQNEVVSQFTTPTPELIFSGPTPTLSPTTAPSYTPGPPTATPKPSPAIFELLLNNFNMMTLEQRDQYIKELNGSEFHHWIGIVREKPLLDDGYYGLSVEIDQNETERPDLVLINMDKAVLDTLEKGQRFRFSGTFSGFINMNGLLNLFAIDKVTVHQ